MKILHALLLIAIGNSVSFSSCTRERDKPFYDEIQTFKAEDKVKFPPKNAILFVGSSSLRMWKDIADYFPGYTVVNRGFGGSGLNDAIEYADDIIIPYHPKQVVIYSGENDIAAGNVTSTDILKRFTTLFTIIRGDLPLVNVVFVSIKPSPSREKFLPVIEESNIMIRQYLSSYPETAYVDVYHPMLGIDGHPRKELFLEDDLHMNAKGYAIWKEAITPYLLK